jgi:hypothetical protein
MVAYGLPYVPKGKPEARPENGQGVGLCIDCTAPPVARQGERVRAAAQRAGAAQPERGHQERHHRSSAGSSFVASSQTTYYDVLRDDGEAYAARLARAGVSVRSPRTPRSRTHMPMTDRLAQASCLRIPSGSVMIK